MKNFVRIILAAVLAFGMLLIAASCGNEGKSGAEITISGTTYNPLHTAPSNEIKGAPADNFSNSGVAGQSSATGTWKHIAELKETDTDKKSHVFDLKSGCVKIRYEVKTKTQSGAVDTGTFSIYLLHEGSTRTKDKNGNAMISVPDITHVGSKNSEKIITVPAGKYYIDIMTVDVENYKIIVEEEVF